MTDIRLKIAGLDKMWRDFSDALGVTFVIGTRQIPRTVPIVAGEAPVNMATNSHGVAWFEGAAINFRVFLIDVAIDNPAPVPVPAAGKVLRGLHADVRFANSDHGATVIAHFELLPETDHNTPANVAAAWALKNRGQAARAPATEGDPGGYKIEPDIAAVHTSARGTSYIKEVFAPKHYY